MIETPPAAVASEAIPVPAPRTPLRVLIVEDSEDSALMVVQVLWRGGFEVMHERVDTAEAMRAALAGGAWDFVLSDHWMPDFDAFEALEVRRLCAPELPFIIVSGVIDEEAAVKAMRMGAADYVMKDNLARLVPAVQRELSDAKVRLERKRGEEALRASEERFRSLTELSADWYWEQDENYRFVPVETGLNTIAPERRIGNLRWENVDTGLSDAQWAAHRAVLDARQSFRGFEYRRMSTGGEGRYVSVSGVPIFDAGGNFKGYRGIGTDITERKRNEQLLALEHSVVRHLANAQDVAEGMQAVLKAVCETEGWDFGRYWGLDEAGGVLRDGPSWSVPSRAIAQFLEASRMRTFAPGEGLIGTVWQSGGALWIPDLLKDHRLAQTDFVVKAGLHGGFLFPVTADGRTVGVIVFGSGEVRRPDERLLAAARVIGSQVGQFVQRMRSEEALRRFRLAMDNSADMILLTDRTTMRHIDVNPAVSTLLGYSRAELLGMGPQDILPLSREELEKTYDQLIADPSLKSGVASHYLCKDGSELPFESTRHVMPTKDGWIIAVISRDSRQRIGAERALKESEERFRSLTALSSDWYWEQDENYRFVALESNPDKAELLSIARYVGKTRWESDDTGLSPAEWDAHRAVLDARKPFREFEYSRMGADGVMRFMSISGEPIFDANGDFSGYRGIGTDITERRRNEQLLALEHAVAAHLAQAQSTAEGMRAVLKSICETEGWVFGRYWGADDTANVLRAVESWSLPGAQIGHFAESSRQRTFAPGEGMVGKVWQSGEAMWVPDLLHDNRVAQAEFVIKAGLHGGCLFPVFAGGWTVGVLAFGSSEVRQPDERLLAASRVIGSQVGQFVQRKRSEEALRRFRLAMDNSVDMILLIGRESMRYIDVNPAVCSLLGYSREEMLEMGPQDLIPVARATLEASYDALIANPSVAGSQHSSYRCKDGSHLPFESTRHVLLSEGRWIIAAISRDIRDRIAREQVLQESEARFRQTFELAASGMAHVDLDHRFLRVNRKLCEMLGRTADELIGHRATEFSYPDDLAASASMRARVLLKEVEAGSIEKRYLRHDGSLVWASVNAALVCDSAGSAEYEILVLEDITERRKQRERIEQLTRVHAVRSGINAAIVRIRDRGDLFRETCRIAVSVGGFMSTWVVEVDTKGKAGIAAATDDDSVAIAVVEDLNRNPAGVNSLMAQALRSGEPMVSNNIAEDMRVQGRAILTETGAYALAILPLKVGKRIAGAIVLRARGTGMFDAEEVKLLTDVAGDVSFALENIEKEKKLDYLALYDSLTGLANRTLFVERLNQSIHAAAQSGEKFAVVLADIERLRTVNESLGRETGDALLKQVAGRFVQAAGRTEVGRVSADQFVMVLPTVKGRSEVGRIVQTMTHGCFSEAFEVNGTQLRVSAKTGIALFPNDGLDAETLIKHAEAALRNGKVTGESFTFFTRDLANRTVATLTLENKLRLALENDEYVLHYQPKVDSETRAIVGMEALIRWQSPELGLVPPMKFIPLLEETGLILEVGSWALKQAAIDHRKWTDAGLRPPKVAVNVSPIQLRRREFVSIVEQAILEGVAPVGIDLEITESLIMEDIEGNIRKLNEVRTLGLDIAIDDFGTGYSSLAYLAKLPVQSLKIDRSFIITMLEDPDTMSLVQTIISLAHSLRLKVVAEGVDQETQAKVLRLLRCDEMQGYLFSKPVAFEALAILLEAKTS